MNKNWNHIEEQLDRIEAMLRQLLHPAADLSVQEKAEAVRRAMDTGDNKILRQTMKQINGEA